MGEAACVNVKPFLVLVLFFALGSSHYVNVSVSCAMLELYSAVNECIECVVTTHAHVLARAMHCAALATDDVTSLCKLTTKNFNAKSFAF